LALSSNVKSIDLLERAALPNEKGATTPSPSQAGRPTGAAAQPELVEKRNVSFVMTLDQGSLQLILSRLANPADMKVRPEADQSFFTSLKVLRVENQTKEGPLRRKSMTGRGSEGNFSSSAQLPPNKSTQGAQANTLVPPAPENNDSVPVIGQEFLKVYMNIDLVKFLDAVRVTTSP